MVRRRGRLIAVPASLALAAACGLAGVSASRALASDLAAPTIAAMTAGPPGGVVLPTVASRSASVSLTARVADASGVDRVVVGVYDPAGRLPDGRSAAAFRTAGTAKDGTWTATVALPRDEPVGTWTVRAFATDVAGNMSDPAAAYATFRVRHATRFTGFDARPEPVAPGGALTLAGVLQRYRPGTGWIPYPRMKVQPEFRAAGTSAWVRTGAVRTTTSAGAYDLPAVTATAGGAWRVTYAGNGSRAPSASHSDTVEVR